MNKAFHELIKRSGYLVENRWKPPSERRVRPAKEGTLDTSYHEWLAGLAAEKSPEVILEVGTLLGSTLIAMLQSCSARAVAVDDFGLVGAEDFAQQLIEFGVSPRVKVIAGKDRDVLADTLETFLPDFVHLDADHSTAGLLQELMTVARAPQLPRTLVVHDVIDPPVRLALERFRADGLAKPWRQTHIADVFNEAMLFESSLG